MTLAEKDLEAKLISMGAKNASADSEIQTMAVSKTAPDQIVGGSTTGATPVGQGVASVPTQFQSLTTSGSGATGTGTPTRYDSAGNVLPGPVATPVASTPATGTPGSAMPSLLTQEQYQAQFGPKPVDEAGIKEQARKDAQLRLDSINAVYDDMTRNQTITNMANAGSTRAINARSGLLGSDFGNTNDANQRKQGDQALAAIQREKDAQITSVLAKVDELAMKKIEAQKAEALGNANAYKDYLEKEQTRATELAKNLGATGETVDSLKKTNPNTLKTLLESSGMSETELTLAMNAARPKASQIDWKTDVQGGNIIMYGIDPITGEMQYKTQALPTEVQANDVKIVDGALWSVSPDGKTANRLSTKEEKPLSKTVGKILYTSLDGGRTWQKATGVAPAPAKGGGGGGGGGKLTETKAMAKLVGGLAGTSVLGSDGFMSPDDYTAFRNAWIQDGYSATAFDTKMKGYRNPNNTNYSINKQ